MRYRYRLFLEREFWTTRRWAFLSLRRAWSSCVEETRRLTHHFEDHGEWYLVAGAGTVGILLTLLLLAAAPQTQLLQIPVRLPELTARAAYTPDAPDVTIDSRLETTPLLAETGYPVLFPGEIGLPPAPSVPVLTDAEPLPLDEPDSGGWELPTPAKEIEAEIDVVVSFLQQFLPARSLENLDADQFEVTGTTGGSSVSADLNGFGTDDGWKLFSGPLGDLNGDMSPSVIRPEESTAASLPPLDTSDVPDPNFGPTGTVAASVEVQSGGGGSGFGSAFERTALSIRNLSPHPLERVEIREQLDADARGVDWENQGTNRWLPSLAAGDEEALPIAADPSQNGPRSYAAQVRLGAAISTTTEIQPAKKNRRLSISIQPATQVRVNEQAKIGISVKNVGETDLEDVRILADLSSGVIHYYGRSVEYLVGPLKRGEEHQTVLIIDGYAAGEAKTILRAIAPETRESAQTADLTVLPSAQEARSWAEPAPADAPRSTKNENDWQPIRQLSGQRSGGQSPAAAANQPSPPAPPVRPGRPEPPSGRESAGGEGKPADRPLLPSRREPGKGGLFTRDKR